MKFSEVVAQAIVWLQSEGRVSYLALQMEFDLSDKQLEALKAELVKAKKLAIDEGRSAGLDRGTRSSLSTEQRFYSTSVSSHLHSSSPYHAGLIDQVSEHYEKPQGYGARGHPGQRDRGG